MGLNFAGAFGEIADEDFGVPVYGRYDGGWEGLGECLIGNLFFCKCSSDRFERCGDGRK